MEAATDLGAKRHEVSPVQHYDFDLLLYRKVLRPFVRPAQLIRFEHFEDREHVVEKEKPAQRN